MIARLVREPALILGVITTGFGLAALFGLPVTEQQIAGVVAFVGAVVALLRFLTVPASEVVVQEKPGGQLVAGPASEAPTGTKVEAVDVVPAGMDVTITQHGVTDQRGAVSRDLILGFCLAGVIVLLLLVLL